MHMPQAHAVRTHSHALFSRSIWRAVLHNSAPSRWASGGGGGGSECVYSIHTYIHTYMHLYIYTHRKSMCIIIYIYIHVHILLYTDTHMHTHTRMKPKKHKNASDDLLAPKYQVLTSLVLTPLLLNARLQSRWTGGQGLELVMPRAECSGYLLDRIRQLPPAVIEACDI